jgi:hypothetical protein
MPAFDFLAFAAQIYEEVPASAHGRFALPALYGGETTPECQAVFVLEAPSVPFTVARWQKCANAEDAVRRHRAIFYEWASLRTPGKLFAALDRKICEQLEPVDSERAFFRRFYITDIWKDAAFKLQRTDRKAYRAYWMTKLEMEFEGVGAQRVVFVGREAERGRSLVPKGIPSYYVPFPSWSLSDAQIATEISRLKSELTSSGR